MTSTVVGRRNRRKNKGGGEVKVQSSSDSSTTGSSSSSARSTPRASITTLGGTEEEVNRRETVQALRMCPCSTPLPSLTAPTATTVSNLSSERDAEVDEERRLRHLKIENVKVRLLLKNRKNENKILTAQKGIRSQQLHILQRANHLNSMFVTSMEKILMLGHCPSKLQDRTDKVSHGLIDVHNSIHKWDQTLEDLIKLSKEQKSMLDTLFDAFSDKYGKEVEGLTDEEFLDLFEGMDPVTELRCDEEKLAKLCKEIDMMDVNKDWDKFRGQVESRLVRFEVEFKEICLEYGLRTPNPSGECPKKKKK